jgi:DNA-binding NtrC family response regulator
MSDTPLPRLLLIEDDEHFRAGLVASLQLAGCALQAFGRGVPALRTLADGGFEVVLTDLRLPDMDGLEILAAVRKVDAELPVIVMTGHGDIATAVSAIQQGAYDFVEKPFGRDRLLTLLQRAAQQRRLALENRGLRSTLAGGAGLDRLLLGDSAAMRSLREWVLQLAPTPVDVLVQGETGTGKELVARALHEYGQRRGAFVAVNCAALPDTLVESELFGHEAGAFTGAAKARAGRFEQADGGTIFLDEVQAMPPAAQAKLLRVLQEREVQRLGATSALKVDLRVVAASNAALEAEVAAGRFRADLFYRLDVVTLRLPPLRERRDDIPALFRHFAAGGREKRSAAPAAAARCRARSTPSKRC